MRPRSLREKQTESVEDDFSLLQLPLLQSTGSIFQMFRTLLDLRDDLRHGFADIGKPPNIDATVRKVEVNPSLPSQYSQVRFLVIYTHTYIISTLLQQAFVQQLIEENRRLKALVQSLRATNLALQASVVD